jgi:hypothetical protein
MVLDPIPCPSCIDTNVVQPSKKVQPSQKTIAIQKQPSRNTITPEKLTEVMFRAEQTAAKITRSEPLEVGRVFLFANFVGPANQPVEAALVLIQNLVAERLRAKGFTVLEVPRGLELPEAIAWINQRAVQGDVALSIQTDAFFNPDARGASAFYMVGNRERQQQAQRLLQQLVKDVAGLTNRGARPDTETALGYLTFTRQVGIPSIVLTVGFKTSPSDRAIILRNPQEIAQGIVNGLAVWSRALSAPARVYSPINVSVNGLVNDQQGIIVNRNAYIPVNSIAQLKANLAKIPNARRINYRNTTYIRAIDLRGADVFVGWIPTTRTVVLRTSPRLALDKIEQIMGRGYLSRKTLKALLKKVNPQVLEQFPEIVELYLEEAAIEGVNPDIAFAQALLETNFFRFSGNIQPSQNNFGALRSAGELEAASFPSARLGVRAHIQQLKTYASFEPLAQEVVTPRFRFVTRGSAPNVRLLSGRYSADPMYGERILAIVRQLYQSAGLL